MPINPRLIRLNNDYQKLREMESHNRLIHILLCEGTPPELYEILLRCRGITSIDSTNKPRFSNEHKLQINLPCDYPREKPEFKMLTPVWHPNIGTGGMVCLGDAGNHGYTPAMGLNDLVMRLIQMIRYENYNPNSYYNSDAAVWAKNNSRLFPLELRR